MIIPFLKREILEIVATESVRFTCLCDEKCRSFRQL